MTKNQEALAERREMKQDSFVPSVTADAAPRESANAGAASRYVAPPIWPNGCIKPGSCSKDTSRRCMYARTREQCPHVDRDIGPEIDAERTRRDRVSDGSPQGQDAKRLDPKDESAAVPAETPHSLPPNPSGFGELVETLRRVANGLRERSDNNLASVADEAATAIETQAAEIERRSVLLSDEYGFVYHNPDTGEEYSQNHPIESGEVPDAMDVRPATSQEQFLYGLWNAAEARIAELEKERDEARNEAYELKLAAAGGEDVPGSASLVTPHDVERWRKEQSAERVRYIDIAEQLERQASRDADQIFALHTAKVAAESRLDDAVKVIEDAIPFVAAHQTVSSAQMVDELRSFLSTTGDKP